jgi:hypothetical protein
MAGDETLGPKCLIPIEAMGAWMRAQPDSE